MAAGATKRDKVVLAYSGGLDTSVMVPWIREKYDLDVIAFTVDLGQGEDIERIRQKALRTGAVDAVAIDARNLFVDLFVWPALMAGAIYEGKYPLATALGRPLIAKLMVDAAREHGARAVAQGRPVGLDGKPLDGVPLIERLNKLGGEHGVGRIDHVENRLVGIKSRELYEAPAGVILHDAHRELETLCLTKQAARFKTLVAQEYADIIYNGLSFSAFHQDLFQFVLINQRFVTGLTRIKLYKGKATVVGRKSEFSLYSKKLATYETGDQFDHDAAKGFIRLHGLGQQTQAHLQLLKDGRGFGLPGQLRHEP